MVHIDPERLHGTWRLVASEATDVRGRALPAPWGPSPMGRLVLDRSGRMMAVLCDGRPEMPPGMTRKYSSYCGRYVVDGDLLTTTVDAASDRSRVGSRQLRTLSFRGEHLVLTPPPGADGERRRIVWALESPG